MPDYVVIAYCPDHRETGDHVACKRDEAIDYLQHCLDEESRDGASVTITIVQSDDQQDDLRAPAGQFDADDRGFHSG
jgi:hypothetical protein